MYRATGGFGEICKAERLHRGRSQENKNRKEKAWQIRCCHRLCLFCEQIHGGKLDRGLEPFIEVLHVQDQRAPLAIRGESLQRHSKADVTDRDIQPEQTAIIVKQLRGIRGTGRLARRSTTERKRRGGVGARKAKQEQEFGFHHGIISARLVTEIVFQASDALIDAMSFFLGAQGGAIHNVLQMKLQLTQHARLRQEQCAVNANVTKFVARVELVVQKEKIATAVGCVQRRLHSVGELGCI